MTTANQDRQKGFEAAMDFYNCEARSTMSAQMVLEIADQTEQKLAKTRRSNWARGWKEAATIIARARARAVLEADEQSKARRSGAHHILDDTQEQARARATWDRFHESAKHHPDCQCNYCTYGREALPPSEY
jgi:hypothetical protein